MVRDSRISVLPTTTMYCICICETFVCLPMYIRVYPILYKKCFVYKNRYVLYRHVYIRNVCAYFFFILLLFIDVQVASWPETLCITIPLTHQTIS